MSSVFLDTNVLVYAWDRTDPAKQARSRAFLGEVRQAGNGVISTQVLQEFFTVCARKLALPPQRVRRVTRYWTRYEVVSMTPQLVLSAIDCSINDQLSLWDALLVVAAESAHCDTLWTEDLQDGRTIRGVHIRNPFK